MKIVDSAVCLNERERAAETWLQLADQYHIGHSIVAPTDAQVAVLNGDGNRRMIELTRAYPGKISGLAVANPWFGSAAVDMLRRAFDDGLIGLYLNPMRQGFRLTESLLDPMMEICDRYDRPVYCPSGVPIFSTPFQLAELARRFPSVRFIMGHGAYPDFWYDVVPALKQAANVLMETSCQVAGIVQAAIDAVGADRVVYGSGYPRSHPSVETAKLERLGLDDETFSKVMHANARQCWRLAS